MPLGAVAASLWLIGPPEVPTVDLSADSTAVSPEQPVLISVPFLRATLATATLDEAPNDDASTNAPRTVPVVLQPVPASAPWQGVQITLLRPDGSNALRPDSTYHLTLTGNWDIPALLWVRFGSWNVEYHFSTKRSPKPLLSGQPVHPRYAEPITLQWNIPVSTFEYRVSPAAATSSALDPGDPRRTYIVLDSYVPGQTYHIKVIAATGDNGVSIQRPYSFSVVTPKAPMPSLKGQDTLRYGEALTVYWDEPIVDFEYQLDPPATTTAAVDPIDRRRALIDTQPLKQGQQYHLTITDARAVNGTHLEQPRTFVLATPPALKLSDTTPRDGEFGISPKQTIGVTFSAPVNDRKSAERALTITPPIDGHFEWVGEREMQFVPFSQLPFESDITLHVAGGPQGPRSEAGGYLEDDYTFTFTTRPDKVIDVDLTRQVVTLLEDGQVVLTSLTATGVRGAETPVGTFMVQYKMRSTRMRGVTPSGSRYDIPDVPWVLAFWGDFTIHGAYWRNGFGFPQSNGCVSLPTYIAERVFRWAPMGTPIVIHY